VFVGPRVLHYRPDRYPTWFLSKFYNFSKVVQAPIPAVAEPPELFQLKCLSPALKARPHLNRNKPPVPRI
jgi:hypothetical protein